MNNKSREIVVSETEEPQPPKVPNLLSLLPKFNLQQLPFFNLKPKDKAATATPNNNNNNLPQPQEQDKEPPNSKPNFVSFPQTQVVVPPPIEAEAEESNTKTSNPLILWQVYALGAIFVSRWIWARWNERKSRGGSPDDERAEGRHSDDAPRSSDNE